MADEVQDKRSIASYFTKKVVVSLSAVATVLTIVAGIWAFEAHYATNSRVDGVAIAAEQKVEQLEIQLAGAFENQQHKSNAKYWQFMLERLMKDLSELKRQMRRYPEDEILREDYRALQERIKEVRSKLDQALEKIK